jgi:hypothetical protein
MVPSADFCYQTNESSKMLQNMFGYGILGAKGSRNWLVIELNQF